MAQFSSLIIGHDTLALNCAKMLAGAGHPIRAVVSRCPEFRAWAKEEGLPLIEPGEGLKDRLQVADPGIHYQRAQDCIHYGILHLHPLPAGRPGHFDGIDVTGNDDDAPGNHLDSLQAVVVCAGRWLAVDKSCTS